MAEELGPLLELLAQAELAGKRGWTFTEAGTGGEPTAARALMEGVLRNAGISVGLTADEIGGELADGMKALGRVSGKSV